MSKRVPVFVLLILCLALVLPVAAQDTSEAAFPVTIDHKFGSTTIEAAPQRIVAIGYTEQDFLLALGVEPVAVRYWYGEEPNAIFPWAQDAANGAEPEVLNMPFGNLNYEAILALEPDLISAVTAGITAEEYETLSQIAPTITQTDEYIDFGIPWQVVTQIIGDAVGKSTEAETIVADTEALFADARASNPQFEGKSVAVAYYYAGTYGFYTPQDSRGRFFTELGFVVPDELLEITGESFYADISAEQVALLDQDLIAIVNLQFIEGGRETLEADPLFGQLAAVQEGRVIYLDEQSENALGFSSPLSLAYALDATLPQLETIFGEATAAVECAEGFWLFDHPLLATDPVCIPENPQQIASLDPFSAEMLISLDMPPVAMVNIPSTLSRLPELEETLTQIIDLGQPADLEILLTSQPDLILAISGSYDEVYEQLSAIAPTIILQFNGSGEWKAVTRAFSEVISQEAAVEAVFTAYNKRIADLRGTLGSDRPVVSVVRAYPDSINLYLRESFPGTILDDAGIPRPESQDYDAETAQAQFNNPIQYTISQENLRDADGDIIIVWTFGATSELAESAQDQLNTLLNDPLWSLLNAVQNEQVYVGGPYWIGSGIYAAHRIIDDLFTYVAGVDPTTVSPNPLFATAATTVCDEGFRLIAHALGETCVPEAAERVIALEWTYAENLLALGLQPVGVADMAGYNNWLQIPVTLDESVIEVGTRQEPNFETIATLEPDLILAVSSRTGQNYELLSAIAPTLVFDAYPVDGTHYDEMVTTFTTIAQAVGREGEAQAVLQAMTDHFAAASQALESAGRAGETFILSQTFLSSDVPTFRLFTDNALAVQTLERIGLVNAWDDAPQQFGFTTVDFEAFAAIEDTNFLYVAQDDYQPTLIASPLWAGLPFVESGRAYWLGGEAWLFGGPLSMQVVVDTVLEVMGVDLPETTDAP